MGNDPRKRQKQLAKRASKRKEKKHLIVREQNAGLADRLTAAAKFPVLDCWIANSVAEKGIGQVLLSRELPNKDVAVAVFLVDVYCLGVKDAFAVIMGRSKYDHEFVRRMSNPSQARRVAPAEARKLIEASVTYARGLGLPPHADYPRTLLLFGGIDAADAIATFTFGQDGKPYFVAGPNDNEARCRQILATLERTCGPGAYSYLLPVSGSTPVLSDDVELLEDEEDAIDDNEA